jgi:hypothetical protein
MTDGLAKDTFSAHLWRLVAWAMPAILHEDLG